jgi:hypothetical protein
MTSAARRVTGVLIAIAMVAAVVFVAPDPAKTAIRSKVTFKVTDRTVRPHQRVIFFGKVKPKKHKKKCRRNRKVVLIQKGEGKVRSKRTDGEGEYSFRLDPKYDKYRVKVKKKKIRVKADGDGGYGYGYGYGYDGKKKKRCRKAKSRFIRIRPVPGG